MFSSPVTYREPRKSSHFATRWQQSSSKQRDSLAEELRVVAGLFAFPGEESLAVLRELAEERLWLWDAAQELGCRSLEHWQAEHTRLFLAGYPRTPCPPFESAYRSGQMGSTSAELSALYGRLGLAPDGIAPDYLGLMLECAAWIVTTHRPQPGDGSDLLWEDHLAPWVPRFAGDLIRESRLILYRRLGERLLAVFDGRA